MVRAHKRLESAELEELRAKINSKKYLDGAIDCLAMILCREMVDIPEEGVQYEQQGWDPSQLQAT
jgi:hypothetical protein